MTTPDRPPVMEGDTKLETAHKVVGKKTKGSKPPAKSYVSSLPRELRDMIYLEYAALHALSKPKVCGGTNVNDFESLNKGYDALLKQPNNGPKAACATQSDPATWAAAASFSPSLMHSCNLITIWPPTMSPTAATGNVVLLWRCGKMRDTIMEAEHPGSLVELPELSEFIDLLHINRQVAIEVEQALFKEPNPLFHAVEGPVNYHSMKPYLYMRRILDISPHDAFFKACPHFPGIVHLPVALGQCPAWEMKSRLGATRLFYGDAEICGGPQPEEATASNTCVHCRPWTERRHYIVTMDDHCHARFLELFQPSDPKVDYIVERLAPTVAIIQDERRNWKVCVETYNPLPSHFRWMVKNQSVHIQGHISKVGSLWND